jgi:HEAT repeat protein
MRLPEAKIKEALLHPEKIVRQEALHYFAKGHTQDQQVMPLAIQAIQTYGRNDAFFFGHLLSDLLQTAATIDWAIQQLNSPDAKQADQEFHLSRLLCQADPKLLLPRQDDILSARGFNKHLVTAFEERLRLLTWDADKCWRELETISERNKNETETRKIGLDHSRHVVEALARQGEKYAERILTLLSQKIDSYENNPMTWMEIFLVMLAGEMRLQASIPLLVAKLKKVEEVLAENCVTALAKIGTDQAALALTDGFAEREWDYRLYASGALENIHADATVSKCLELLPQEKELDLKTNLAVAVISNFAPEGVEPVRAMIQRDHYDPQMENLPGRLAATCIIMGVEFPERDTWKRQAEEKLATIIRNIRDMETPKPRPLPLPPVSLPFASKAHPKQKVGRNDPCPCGSGKKFKHCCMKK